MEQIIIGNNADGDWQPVGFQFFVNGTVETDPTFSEHRITTFETRDGPATVISGYVTYSDIEFTIDGEVPIAFVGTGDVYLEVNGTVIYDGDWRDYDGDFGEEIELRLSGPRTRWRLDEFGGDGLEEEPPENGEERGGLTRGQQLALAGAGVVAATQFM